MPSQEIPKKTSGDFFKGSIPIAIVAGGAGFIGSHLCEKLLEKQVKVLCIDNWLTGVKENVSHLFENERFAFLEQDINEDFTDEIERADYVIHLAGVEAYLNGEDISIETLEANSVGTKNLLEFAKKKKARFLLVSTINVFSANISQDSVDFYFGKGREAEGEFSQHEAKRFAEALTTEYGQKEGVDVRVVRISEVYGPRMMLSSGRIFAQLVKEAVYGGPLLVPGGEELILYPAYVEDVVHGIEKTLFSSGTKNKIVSLAGPKVSAFTLAQNIQSVAKNNPQLSGIGDLEIQFKDTEFPQIEINEEVLSTGRDVISWTPKTTLEEGLSKTLVWLLGHKSRVPKAEEEKMKKKEKAGRSFWGDILQKSSTVTIPGFPQLPGGARKVSLLLLAVLVTLIPFILPFFQVGIGLAQLALGKNAILANKTEQGEFWAKSAHAWLKGGESSFIWWSRIPGLGNESQELATKVNALSQVALIEKSAAVASREASTLFEGILGGEPFDPQQAADRLALEFSVLDRNLAFLEALLGPEDRVLDLPFFPAVKLSESIDFISARNAIAAFSKILPHTSELLGRESKKTYLFLFQNNMELRPTGGFIGSFALVTFDKGRLINIEVQDVYTADGQLKGHVEPPEPIKRHLNEAAWFLRDSNWSPDFVTTARRAAWFIDKELGQQVYGVIGLDLELAKELTRAYGPLSLPDFNEQITANNLYEKTQYAVEGNFFPGSRAKKDFLTALSRALLNEIFAAAEKGEQKNLLPAAKAMLAALEGRHMAIWMDNPEVSSALQRVAWDGSLKTPRCRTEASCIADYMMTVDANLGVNKANYFLERSYSMELAVEKDSLVHQLTISYKNNSEPGGWPGGDYRNYLRVFAPQNADLSFARITNPQTGEQERLEVDEESERREKKSFGTLAVVPAKESRQVTFVWTTPVAKIVGSQELIFLWQKQMGTPDDSIWLRFNLSNGSNVEAYPAPSLTAPTNVAYNTELGRDLLFNIKWQR